MGHFLNILSSPAEMVMHVRHERRRFDKRTRCRNNADEIFLDFESMQRKNSLQKEKANRTAIPLAFETCLSNRQM
tara:strand:- start:577 stop:801 length:225 start_codon:yes stop_codon:yes gene_type:complete